jgi:hypothetical protein
LISGLNERGVRYLVVGGLAVIAHGFTRLTQDIDILLDLENAAGLSAAIALLERLGCLPRAPVPFAQFADPARREEWRTTEDMLVFARYHPNERTEADHFISMPFDFAAAWSERLESDIGDGIIASFVDLRRLIDMKRQAGREKDPEDVRVLQEVDDASSGA